MFLQIYRTCCGIDSHDVPECFNSCLFTQQKGKNAYIVHILPDQAIFRIILSAVAEKSGMCLGQDTEKIQPQMIKPLSSDNRARLGQQVKSITRYTDVICINLQRLQSFDLVYFLHYV